jgi:electron transfer flavoprotein beta subunit
MSIIVLLKDIPDLTELKLDPSSNELKIRGVKRRIGDLDLRALEAALRLREKMGGKVVTLTLGKEGSRSVLLRALAMGADESIIVLAPELVNFDSLSTSRILEAAIRRIGNYKLIIAGEMSLDGLNSQVGPRIAELLDIPQITYVRGIEASENMVIAVRDLEDGDEVIEGGFPLLLSVVREINEPRIPSLMNIMKAKKKPMVDWSLDEIGLPVERVADLPMVSTEKVDIPKVERKGIVIKADSAEEAANKLVQHLIKEGVIEV